MPATVQQDAPNFNEQLTDTELLDFCFESRTDSRAFFEPIWKEAGYFWNVNASESFSAADKKHLQETQRPDIDPPFAAGVLEAVIGSEWAQQTEPVFQGVDKGYEDEVIADWLTQLIRNGFALTEADNVMMEAFSDMLVGGYGFVEWFIDLHRTPFRVVPKHLNFWQCWPDPDAVERNLRDANFFIFESYWRLEDAIANWPGKELALRGASTGRKGASGVSPTTTSTDTGGRRRRKDHVLIITFQYRRSVKRVKYVDPESGEEVDSTLAEYEARKAEVNAVAEAELADFDRQLEAWQLMADSPEPMMAENAGPMPPQPQPLVMDETWEAENMEPYNGYQYRRARVSGESKDTGSILDDKEIDLPLPGDEPGFTVKAVTGYAWKISDEQRVRRFGMMRKIAPVQYWFTKAVQSYLELQSRKIKGGGLAEKGAFDGVEGGFKKFVKMSSSPGMWHEVADGALSGAYPKIKEFASLQGEPGVLEIVHVMREMFGWLTGMTQGNQGTMTSDRSNVLTENLQEKGLQMLLPIRKPRQAFLLSCGRLFAAIALKHLPAEELDRILGVQEVEGMTVEKAVDPMTGRPQLGPNGKPVLQPIVGADGEPMTAGKILKQANLLEYDLQADVSAANQSEKMRFMEVWNQHGLGKILADAMPGPKGTKIWLPRLFRNLPMPATDAKAMSAEAEQLLQEEADAQTAQGILTAFQGILESDPQAAAQIHQQLMALVEQAGAGGEVAGQEQPM